jgi:hypothetical protein
MKDLVRACAIGTAAGALAACAGPAASGRMSATPAADGVHVLEPLSDGSVRVRRTSGTPFTYADGWPARQAADALCGSRGVRSSMRDRFDGDAWVFAEGCA